MGCILKPRLIAFLMRLEKFIFCLPSTVRTHAVPERPGDYGEEKGHFFNHTGLKQLGKEWRPESLHQVAPPNV